MTGNETFAINMFAGSCLDRQTEEVENFEHYYAIYYYAIKNRTLK